ncbi:uncharacterized protein LOC122643158 [Telopea speciosissima]|uniref:uncharacterized protein LOC122643158 n=1 Tax=Telopea speciosissima TaxID=54955 RepID=UPI001CC571B7|nr:uncharacterized protein LOC122643158 [Telopea speciosissima]
MHAWPHPPSKWVAANCDGSIRDNLRGYDTIGRDASGQALFAVAGATPDGSILRMELLAMKCGLLKARDLNITHVQVRSDSTMVVQLVLGTYQTPWHSISLVEDIQELQRCFRGCVFQHHVRETNSCADILVGFVFNCQELNLCVNRLPAALSNLLRNDATGKKYYRL